jgi:A/G-specific adenine glycosylase
LFDSEEALHGVVPAQWHQHLRADAVFTHVLTHKDLHLHPWQLTLPDQALDWDEGRWVSACEWPALGLPAPIRKLLQRG